MNVQKVVKIFLKKQQMLLGLQKNVPEAAITLVHLSIFRPKGAL